MAAVADSTAPPPAYTQNAESAEDLRAQVAALSVNELASPSPKPNVSQAICHLKLLFAFQTHRNKISSTKGLFDIHDVVPEDTPTGEDSISQAKLLLRSKIPEKRWSVYITRAVVRFSVWWEALRKQKHAQWLKLHAMSRGGPFKAMVQPTGKWDHQWMAGTLPPLDVLIVWHAFMLNPHAYLEDCLSQGMMQMWHQGMPWAAVDRAVNPSTGKYEPDADSVAAWKVLTNLPWDNLDDASFKLMYCPECKDHNRRKTALQVPWTTAGKAFADAAQVLQRSSSLNDPLAIVNQYTAGGVGIADSGFQVICNVCRSRVDHDRCRAEKFNDAARGLRPKHHILHHGQLEHNVSGCIPLPGTILSIDKGCPQESRPAPDLSGDVRFPNHLIQAYIILRRSGRADWKSMMQIRDGIEAALKDEDVLRYTTSNTRRRRIPVPRQSRIAIRRVMSRFWENSSPFAIDLVGAVIRQGSFVQKMQEIDWLHSPALAATMDRLIVKYERFFKIMADYPKDMAVPTLDVDLAWHTHQLVPGSYYFYSNSLAKKFIDHDDKVAETKLSDSFAKTSERYQRLFKEPYSLCVSIFLFCPSKP